MKKFKCLKVLASSIFVLSLFMGSVCMVMAAEESVANTVYNSNGKEVGYSKEFTADDVSELRHAKTGTRKAPTTEEGYVFGGWYQDAGCTKPWTNGTTDNLDKNLANAEAKFYAKFVYDDILNNKVQIIANTDSTTETTTLRLVTTVDDLNYDRVGFDITMEGKTYTHSTTRVCRQLYAVGTDGEMSSLLPTEFHDGSMYFLTVNITHIPETSYNSPVKAIPYWITCDGTKVQNANIEDKSVALGMSEVCEARVTNDSGKDKYYLTLEKAFYVLNSTNHYLDDGDTVIVIQDDVEIDKRINVYKNVTLTNEANRDVVITRNYTDSHFIYYNSSALTIEGNVPESNGIGSLTFDGEEIASTHGCIESRKTDSSLTLQNVSIEDMLVTRTGGAVHAYGTVAVSDCTFENNVVNIDDTTETNGGAIYYRGSSTMSVEDCKFISNQTTFGQGGAIYVYQGGVEINGSCFDSNSSAGMSGGGAIYVRVGDTTISDTEFSANEAVSGGAMYVWRAKTTLSGCTFTSNNSNEANGGAIYYGEDTEHSKTLKLTNCTFDSNNAVSTGNGGALYLNYGTTLVNGGTFKNNGANGTDLGGAIYVNQSETTISGAEFCKNIAASKGGAVYDNAGEVTIKEASTFLENSAADGGALYEHNGVTTVSNSYFTSNVSEGTNGGGAIYYRGEVDAVLTLTNSTFTSNKAGNRGGAIYVYTGTSTIEGSQFSSNGLETTPYGGAIYVRQGTTTVSNTKFDSNSATINGGALYNLQGTLEVKSNCTFVANEAGTNGGAIYTDKDTATLSIGDSAFTSNSAYLAADTKDEANITVGGGAIYTNATPVTIENSVFDQNSGRRGGSIYANQATAIITVNDSTFTSNRAYATTDISTIGGGAIYFNESVGAISHSDFDNNIGRRGGAIHVNAGSVTIENGCVFSGNTARRGGAMYLYSTGNGAVTDTLFVGNGTTASGSEVVTAYGGAIQCYNEMPLDGCVFDQNAATNSKAVYSALGKFAITNATLINQAETDFNTARLTLLTQENALSETTSSVDNIHDADDNHQMSLMTNIDENEFEAYCGRIESIGFELKAENTMGEGTQRTIARTYYSTERGYMLHTYWVEYSKEVRTQVALIEESMLRPLITGEAEEATGAVCTPLFHQLKALSYDTDVKAVEGGMGYIVRLTDGRFVVIDGGTYLRKTLGSDGTTVSNTYYNNAYEILKFMAENTVLKDENGNPKIVIASWMFTHAHADHIGAFEYFVRYTSDNDSTREGETDTTYYDYWLQAKVLEQTGISIANDGVTLESIMFNPCNTDAQDDYCSADVDETNKLVDEFINVYVPGTPIYKPLTGQEYKFADTSIEILYTMSDFLPQTIGAEPDGGKGDYNVQTVVSMIDINCNKDISDKIFIMGDTTKVACDEMSARYGTYMESNYVQVAHHGYNVLTYYDNPENENYNVAKNSRRHNATQEIYELILKDDGSTIIMWPTSDERFAKKTQEDATATGYIAINDWLYRTGQPDSSKHWIAESVSDENRTVEFE